MGKKGNKRKKSVDSVDGCSEASDTSTDQGPGANTSMISKVLGAANRVLYGAPGGTPTSPIPDVNTSPSASQSTSPSASTPK